MEVCVLFLPVCPWKTFSLMVCASSEGVQVGNVASATGIVGTWTGASHDRGSCSLFFFSIHFCPMVT
jgi:hypothetical protein